MSKYYMTKYFRSLPGGKYCEKNYQLKIYHNNTFPNGYRCTSAVVVRIQGYAPPPAPVRTLTLVDCTARTHTCAHVMDALALPLTAAQSRVMNSKVAPTLSDISADP